MKLRRLAFILFAVLAFLSLPVYAHPGRTDSNGGHTDHSTGEYHYHHGYGAHQHYDLDGDGILDCPFENLRIEKEKPSSNNSTNASQSSTPKKQETAASTVSSEIPAENKSEKSSKKTEDKIENILVFAICVSPFVLPYIIGLCKSIKEVMLSSVPERKKKQKRRG